MTSRNAEQPIGANVESGIPTRFRVAADSSKIAIRREQAPSGRLALRRNRAFHSPRVSAPACRIELGPTRRAASSKRSHRYQPSNRPSAWSCSRNARSQGFGTTGEAGSGGRGECGSAPDSGEIQVDHLPDHRFHEVHLGRRLECHLGRRLRPELAIEEIDEDAPQQWSACRRDINLERPGSGEDQRDPPASFGSRSLSQNARCGA